MAEPFTAAAIGAVLVTKGIGFLYDQLGELLKRHRERKDAKAAEPVQIPPAAPAAARCPASSPLGRSISRRWTRTRSSWLSCTAC